MMATGVPQGSIIGPPPPGLAFQLDEWVPCDVYLGFTKQQEVDTTTNGDFTRVVARLQRRHEREAGRNVAHVRNEVYVKVVTSGFTVRIMAPMTNRLAEDEVREGTREFFETVRIARCSTNHEPCPPALVWVYNRPPPSGFTGDGTLECHGVVCRDVRDATRLVNTMVTAFYTMKQLQSVGNASGGGAVGSLPFEGSGGASLVTPLDEPPAYRPPSQILEPLPRRIRLRDQPQILQIASVRHPVDGEEESDDYELELSPRAPGQRSVSPRGVTPRNTAGTSVSNPMSSDNCSSPRSNSQANMRNSTVSLHSTISASERPGTGRRKRSSGLPGIESGFEWDSSNV
ncbi:uncharacterized protein LOC117299018 [Asterias rubens]|uniref:uncharacterized protein LOC117299018 n=1 Tax=Asterias rubens TaxID=7604 RepID=UPI001455A1E8|nr:uncharacterized protein LOC117299018 [Asterias rubens]